MFSECTGIRLSVCPSVCVSICVQNTSVCQSAGGGTKLHLVTGLVIPEQNKYFQGYIGISLSVFLSMYPSVYQILGSVKTLVGVLSIFSDSCFFFLGLYLSSGGL